MFATFTFVLSFRAGVLRVVEWTGRGLQGELRLVSNKVGDRRKKPRRA